MLLFVGPSGTDTFIVTVMIFTAVAKQICKLTFHNLTTVIFRVLTLSVSWCVSVCWVCERFSGPHRPECLQVASMETCSENTAAAQPGMRYLVCGEACYLTRGPPITTPCSLPRFVRSLIQMEIETRLKGCWVTLKQDTDNNLIWKQPTVHVKKEDIFDDHMKASESWLFCPPFM